MQPLEYLHFAGKRLTALALYPMENFQENTLVFLKWITALSISAWAGVSANVRVLVMMVVLDYVTGFIAGIINKNLDREIGYKGLGRKVQLLILVLACHIVAKPLNLGIDVGKWIALVYIFNEFISLIENCARCGVPVPAILIESLAKFKQFRVVSGTEVEKQLEKQGQ